MKTETQVKTALRRWWNKFPGAIRIYAYCQPCSAGVADYIGTAYGKAVAVEVKKEGGKKGLRPTQAIFKKQWEMAQGLFFLVDSLEDCKQQFTEAGINPVSPKEK